MNLGLSSRRSWPNCEPEFRHLKTTERFGACSRYGHTADTGDLDGFVDLYTSDAVIDLPAISAEEADLSGATVTEGRMAWKGKDGIRRYTAMLPDHLRMHLQDNVVTHIDGDEGVAHAYQVSLTKKDGVTSIVGASNNRWQFKKIDGHWLMKERRAAYLGDDYYFGNLHALPE